MNEKIVNEVVQGLERIVPVIGEKGYLYKNQSGELIPLQTFVVERFIAENKDYQTGSISQAEFSNMCESAYFGLTMLQKRFNTFFAAEYRSIVTSNIDGITLSPSLMRFLLVAKPRIIITTSPFDILERLLPGYASFYYDCKGDRNFQILDDKPTIYHLFGEAQQYSDNWVHNETSLLRFLHYLHNLDSSPSILADYLKNRGTLFLGCDFPDWLFRFLWYSMSIKRDPQFKPNQTAGYWFGENSNESSFSLFLQEISYRPQEDVDSILNAVVAKLASHQRNDEFSHSLPYDIFLSHASEDDDLCEEIADKLQSRWGLRVWFDRAGSTEIVDGNYYQQFADGIKNSRFFMPIVTEHYMIKFMQAKLGGETAGLVEETSLAVENMREKYPNQVYSLPVIKAGDRLYNFELNATNLEKRFSSGQSPVLPPSLFYHIQFFFYKEEGDSNDTFHKHNWTKYSSAKSGKSNE